MTFNKTRGVRAAVLAALLAAVAVTPMAAQATDAPYRVSVWTRVLFGPDGKPQSYELVDEAMYPAAFVEQVKSRIAKASIKRPMVDGQPGRLRSGVEMRFLVTPSEQGGTVKVLGIQMAAMPVRTYLASYPRDIGRTGGWTGEASAVCQVSVEGRCSQIDVKALPGMPESVRRYMRASLEGWAFEPQQIDGQPIESEYVLNVSFNTRDSRPDDFRQDKFLRLLRQR